MGGGSTVAAALAVGYDNIGIESDPVFYRMAERPIPELAKFGVEGKIKEKPQSLWKTRLCAS